MVNKKIEHRLELMKAIIDNKKTNFFDYTFSKYYNTCFSFEDIQTIWKEFILESPKDEIINLYVHTPFCLRKCNFCQCKSEKLNKQNQLKDHLANIISQINVYSKIFKTRKISCIYFGGGTPSIYSEDQLKTLFDMIKSKFNIIQNESFSKTIEINPSVINLEKLKLMKEFGFNRLSMGVQSFNPETLKIENRTFTSVEQVKKIVDYAKKLKFKYINTDLILGLGNEGLKDVLYSIKELIKILPDSICIYSLQENIRRSALFKTQESFYDNVKTFVQELKKIDGIENYLIYSGNISRCIVLHKKSKNKYFSQHYEQYTIARNSVLGIGKYSLSRIFGKVRYEITNESDKLIAKGINLNFKDEISSNVMTNLEKGKINIDEFRNNFNLDFIDIFREEILYLINKKIIFFKDNCYHMNQRITQNEKVLYSTLFYSKNLLKFFIISNLKKIK